MGASSGRRRVVSFTLRTSLILAGAALGLAGCTSDGEPTSKAVATPAGSTAAVPRAALSQAPVPTKVRNQPQVRRHVVQTSCAAVPGGWQATGTAENPGAVETTYKITVFFTTAQATVLDYATTKVTVKPGATKQWSAVKQFPAQQSMLCPMPGIAVVR